MSEVVSLIDTLKCWFNDNQDFDCRISTHNNKTLILMHDYDYICDIDVYDRQIHLTYQYPYKTLDAEDPEFFNKIKMCLQPYIK